MSALLIRSLPMTAYEPVWDEMKTFTDQRDSKTTDELWLVQHPAVFTLGQAGKEVHILEDVGIPIVRSDRGGQVTYHGPGQLVIYVLIDLRRNKLGVRDLVSGIENSIIALLANLEIEAAAKKEAPGVYVAGEKIAALGLRVRKGRSYHGLSLNVKMDLAPFSAINPCGYEDLGITQLSDLGVDKPMVEIEQLLVNEIVSTFGYDEAQWLG